MKNKRYINEFFEHWGKENLKTPANNLALKSEMLSRVSETEPAFKKSLELITVHEVQAACDRLISRL